MTLLHPFLNCMNGFNSWGISWCGVGSLDANMFTGEPQKYVFLGILTLLAYHENLLEMYYQCWSFETTAML